MDAAQQYAESDCLQKRDVFDFLTEYMEDVKWSPGDVVLDIGCGPGGITADVLLPKLPNNFGHLVGGDISEDMVQYATDNFVHPKLSFAHMDIATQNLDLLKFKSLVGSEESDGCENDGIFHKIFSFFCLQWVDQKQTLKNIYDLLKPGGDGLLLIVANTPLYTLYEIMSKKTRWQPFTKDVSHVESPADRHTLSTLETCLAKSTPPQEFSDLLQEEGFDVIRCKTETRSFQFQTMNGLKEGCYALEEAVPYGSANSSSSTGDKIVGGSDVTICSYPHQVSLTNNGDFLCSGSIISRNWVLTAAQCAQVSTDGMLLRAGSIYYTKGGNTRKVVQKIVHESYNSPQALDNDVALLKVIAPWKYGPRVKKIALPAPNQEVPAGVLAAATGWGYTQTGGSLNPTLKMVKLTTMSNTACAAVFGAFVTDVKLCAEYPSKGICYGDGGGPLEYNNQLIGVTSFLSRAGCALYPSGFARVAAIRSWITTNSGV